MGLVKGGREGMQYLKVSDGKLRIKSNEEDPNAEKRVVEMNGEKHILYETNFSKVSGYITGFHISTHDEYGDQLNIIIEDVVNDKEELYQLQMSDTTRYFQVFCQLLPNIDFSLPVTFQPYSFTPAGAKYKSQGVKIVQGVKKVLNYYKTWDEIKQISKLKNGLQKFDFAAAETKDEKKILKIQLTTFLKTELEVQQGRLQDFFKSLDDGDDDPDV